MLCLVLITNAQSQMGEIRGKVIDAKTKKPISYASITFELNGLVKGTTLSDDDGSYIQKTLQPGEYTIKVTYLGYRNAVITDVDVVSDQITFQNIPMESTDEGKVLDEVVIKRKPPLVNPDQRGTTKGAKEIMALPQRNVNMIANTTAGVDSRAGSTPNFRGARAEGTAYYIDGQRVYGSLGVPQNAIDQVQIITGGTPAQYGDFIGGAISFNTKAPSKNWNRGVEYITSSPFGGYLDNSQYNSLQTYVSGPIMMANKGKGDKERVLLGFTFATETGFSRDGRLPATNIYTLTEAKQREINNAPLQSLNNGGFINKGEFLTAADLRQIDYRQNASSYSLNAQGNFVYQPANNISIKLGYQASYGRGRGWSYYYSLMNPEKNTLSTSFTGRVYLQYTQRFEDKKGEEAKKSLISNAFYSVRVSYENSFSESMDAEFEKDIFKYGYIGKLTSYPAPVYQRIAKSTQDSPDVYVIGGRKMALTYYVKHVGFRDTLVTFQQADYNKVRGNYTKEIFDYANSLGGKITNTTTLRALNGLINGDNPSSIYSGLWGAAGTQTTGSYSKSNAETVQLYVMSEASVGSKKNTKSKHDLQFGMNFEQRFIRSYGVAGSGLWNLMRLLSNTQFSGLDSSTATGTFDQNGVFQDTVRFSRLIVDTAQSTFDRNFRSKLIGMGALDQYGKKVDQQTFLDPNMYDPSMFSLNMFSADELLNNGNAYVGYNGYDYLGNRVTGKPGVNKFLNDSKNRTIGAYQPIYTAAWLQDKFVFKDLIVRIGVRVERFDANQVVLKDPYSMAAIYTAGDIRRAASAGSALGSVSDQIPSSVGDDYAVYVNANNADAVVNKNFKVAGFRNGNDWYDKSGNPVTDPNTIWKTAVNEGAKINRNTPYLVTAGQVKPDAASFTDYKADVKVLPRISFSFPVSATSQFFGTYDVLAQRPSANVAQIDDYYYLTLRQGSVIQNPNLRMTQVTDYQIGFRQQIGPDAALGIKGSYREFRNLIQLYNFNQAWPVSYISYSNIDFSTVKSVDIEYELRDLGNVTLSANYMLQFADGTGSNSASSSALIAANLPQQRNVYPLDYDTRHALKGIFDFHYKDGKEYDGPVVGGRKIFTNAGINLIFNYVSGRPYTQQILPTSDLMVVTNRPQVKGTPNGSRQPSQFYADINIDKNFMFRSSGLDGKTTTYRLRVFLWVQNIFNNVNALGVYRYTGSAYSDGYIKSVQADATLRAATNAQSLVDLYNIKMVDPSNFALPRLTRLGLALYF